MKNPRSEALVKRLDETATPVVEELGYDVVELQFVDARRPVVRLFIDKDGGVGLDDCASVSRRVGERLDLLDVLPGPYHLEVSSPGIGRPFRIFKQYLRAVNHKVEVVLEAPIQKRHELKGVLLFADLERIRLQLSSDELLEIPMTQIKRTSRTVEL